MISRVKEKGNQIKYHSQIHLIVKHHFLKKEYGKEKWLESLSLPIKKKMKKGPITKRGTLIKEDENVNWGNQVHKNDRQSKKKRVEIDEPKTSRVTRSYVRRVTKEKGGQKN